MYKPGSVQTDTLPRSASTAVLLDKAGVRYAVYHVSRSGAYRWQHSIAERCPACGGH